MPGNPEATRGVAARLPVSATEILTWSWGQFGADSPSLAEYGRSALASHRSPAFLATVRGDSLPRVHPVTPLVTTVHLALYMYPNSPKGHDLQRDGRFAIHSAVSDHDGSDGEFSIRGIGLVAEENDFGVELADLGVPSKEGFVRYVLTVATATAVTYRDDKPLVQRWNPPRQDQQRWKADHIGRGR